jgi:hypothetical protein
MLVPRSSPPCHPEQGDHEKSETNDDEGPATSRTYGNECDAEDQERSRGVCAIRHLRCATTQQRNREACTHVSPQRGRL